MAPRIGDAVDHAAIADPAPRPRRRRVRLRWILLVLVLLLLALAAYGVWAAKSARAVIRAASATRNDLHQAQSELTNGAYGPASSDITQARTDLSVAETKLNALPLRIASHIPFASTAVADAQRVVRAERATYVVGSRSLEFYRKYGTHGQPLFSNGQVDMRRLTQANALLEEIHTSLTSARRLLVGIHPHWYEPGLRSARNSALASLVKAQGRIEELRGVFSVLPEALGANGTANYVITVLNPGELRASGGAPLSLALASFRHGALTISHRGQTLDLTNNQPVAWAPVPADERLGHVPQLVRLPLVDATLSASWPVAGEELLRAYRAQFGVTPDGVLAIDPVGVSRLLEVTGPLSVAGLPEITAQNLVQTIIGSYRTDSVAERHQLNDVLMDVMFTRLLGGGHMMDKVRVLQQAATQRHLLMYFRQPTLARQLRSHHLDGALPSASDFAGVYTQNTNASKVDFFQHRRVRQVVTLNADGSASIQRTVTITNAAPKYEGAGTDPGNGYFTAVSVPNISLYFPQRAINVRVLLDGRAVPVSHFSSPTLRAVSLTTTIESGQTATVTLQYTLPHALLAVGATRWYTLAFPIQAMINPVDFELVMGSQTTTMHSVDHDVVLRVPAA